MKGSELMLVVPPPMILSRPPLGRSGRSPRGPRSAEAAEAGCRRDHRVQMDSA